MMNVPKLGQLWNILYKEINVDPNAIF